MKKEMMDNLIGKYKRGKYLESIIGKAMKNSNLLVLWHKLLLSNTRTSETCRKFNFMCKTQSSVKHSHLCLIKMMKCGHQEILSIDIQLSLYYISNNVLGVTRTVTGLGFFIIDLHLRLPHLCQQLVWHFVFSVFG